MGWVRAMKTILLAALFCSSSACIFADEEGKIIPQAKSAQAAYEAAYEKAIAAMEAKYPDLLDDDSLFYKMLNDKCVIAHLKNDHTLTDPNYVAKLADQIAADLVAHKVPVKVVKPPTVAPLSSPTPMLPNSPAPLPTEKQIADQLFANRLAQAKAQNDEAKAALAQRDQERLKKAPPPESHTTTSVPLVTAIPPGGWADLQSRARAGDTDAQIDLDYYLDLGQGDPDAAANRDQARARFAANDRDRQPRNRIDSCRS